MNYSEYLRSEHWQKTREETLERDNHECCFCGSKENLNVHHLSYKRLGCELPEDLITLCRNCHQKLHELTPVYSERVAEKKEAFHDAASDLIEKEFINYTSQVSDDIADMAFEIIGYNKNKNVAKIVSVIEDAVSAKNTRPIWPSTGPRYWAYNIACQKLSRMRKGNKK